jgi:hypothetical protein
MDDNLGSHHSRLPPSGTIRMVFEHIDKLKQEYTDKYVIVDNRRPELRRFDGQTGVVRTVNMNGQALVEFDAYENIGWYDIDVDFLKIIDKPLPKPELKPEPEKKPAAKKQKQKAPATGGMSVEEMLAAARGEGSGQGAGAATKPQPTGKSKTKPTEKPAAKSAPGGAGMSVEEMLAAARGEKSDTAAATPTTAAAQDKPAPVAQAPAETTPPPQGDLPTDIGGILAYCRRVDAS